MPQELHKEPIALAITTYVFQQRAIKKWKWATTLKMLASIQGALYLLPMYRAVPHGLLLRENILWRQTLQATARRVREERPRTPDAMTAEQFQAAMLAERDNYKQAVLMLMWFTTARVGCITQLEHRDLVVNPNNSISITFMRGKSAKVRGPYTVHTCELPTFFLEYVQRIHQPGLASSMFNLTPADPTQTYRRANPRLEARSVRGALQAMALCGTPAEVLDQQPLQRLR